MKFKISIIMVLVLLTIFGTVPVAFAAGSGEFYHTFPNFNDTCISDYHQKTDTYTTWSFSLDDVVSTTSASDVFGCRLRRYDNAYSLSTYYTRTSNILRKYRPYTTTPYSGLKVVLYYKQDSSGVLNSATFAGCVWG